MTDTVIKYCKDCKFFKYDHMLPSLSKCNHIEAVTKSTNIDMVNGNVSNAFQEYCSQFRKIDHNKVSSCGPEAIYFESKETNFISKEKETEVSFILKTYNSAWLCFGIFLAIVFALKMFL